MTPLTELDKAYIAGLLDGEGCVGYYNANHRSGTPYGHAFVSICNTDPRVIYWVLETVGIGAVSVTALHDKKRRPAYQWQLGRKAQVREFLESIRPYLKVKGEQVDVLLAHFMVEEAQVSRHGSVTTEVIARRRETELKLKALKRMDWTEGVETRQAGSLH